MKHERKKQPKNNIKAMRLAAGMTLEQLGQVLGIGKAAMSHKEKGISPVTTDELARLAAALDCDIDHLLHDNVTRLSQKVTKPSQFNGTKAPRDSADGYSTLVPVYGPAAASHPERILLTDDFIVEKMERPKELLRIKEGFVMYVVGDSMRPRYKDRELVSVNPNLKPHKEQDCVIVLDEEGNALVKEFAGETDTEFKFKQYNPEKIIKLKKADVRALYAVVGRPI